MKDKTPTKEKEIMTQIEFLKNLTAEEYLDREFPKDIYYRGVKKPKSQLRGQAMVLLALAKEEGRHQEIKNVLRIIEDNTDYEIESFVKHIKEKMGIEMDYKNE